MLIFNTYNFNMRNYLLQAKAGIIAFFLLFITGTVALAQSTPKADNSIHDKMYYMIQGSSKVSLPPEVSQELVRLNTGNSQAKKAIFGQTSVLKVLYNTGLSKSDRLFFGEHILKNESPAIVAIRPDIKKLLANL